MSRLNYGHVEVTVCDETYVLKPTLAVMDAIERRWPEGGLRAALEACGTMGARHLAYVIAAGANLGKKEARELPDAVFIEGTVRVAPAVLEFLTVLIDPTGKGEDEDSPQDNDQSGEQ